MWDTNITIVVFSKYTGGDAGRSIVEEEISFITILSSFLKGTIFLLLGWPGSNVTILSLSGSLVPLGNDAILGAPIWSVLLVG